MGSHAFKRWVVGLIVVRLNSRPSRDVIDCDGVSGVLDHNDVSNLVFRKPIRSAFGIVCSGASTTCSACFQ